MLMYLLSVSLDEDITVFLPFSLTTVWMGLKLSMDNQYKATCVYCQQLHVTSVQQDFDNDGRKGRGI